MSAAGGPLADDSHQRRQIDHLVMSPARHVHYRRLLSALTVTLQLRCRSSVHRARGRQTSAAGVPLADDFPEFQFVTVFTTGCSISFWTDLNTALLLNGRSVRDRLLAGHLSSHFGVGATEIPENEKYRHILTNALQKVLFNINSIRDVDRDLF